MPQKIHNEGIDHSPLELAHVEGDFSAMLDIHDETVAVHGLFPVCQPEDIGLASQMGDMTQSIAARLAIPLNRDGAYGHFVVVRRTVGKEKATYGLQGLTMSYITGKPTVTLLPMVPIPSDGSDITIGKASKTDEKMLGAERLWIRQRFGTAVSRRHVSIAVHNDIIGVEDHSSNGTRIAAGKYTQRPKVMLPASEYETNHTAVVIEKARIDGLHSQDTFAGRKFITHRSEVGGSSLATIDFRSWSAGGESIVIDPSSAGVKGREQYARYFDATVERIKDIELEKGSFDDRDVCRAISDTIYANMEYDLDWVERDQKERLAKNPTGSRKVNLAYYMHAGKGVCRQMGDAAAWLGGELKQAGYLKHGKVTAPVKQIGNDAHEYALYTDDITGEEIAIDPANKNYVGPPLTTFFDYSDPDKQPDTPREFVHYEQDRDTAIRSMRRIIRTVLLG